MAIAIHFKVGTADKPICGMVNGKNYTAEWDHVTCRSCLRCKDREEGEGTLERVKAPTGPLERVKLGDGPLERPKLGDK